MPITDAIILAGGFGTRLRPLTTRTPKPLLSVGGRPFLETLFARLARGGMRRVVLSVHHNAGALRRALPGLRRFGLAVELRREPRPLGTGGALRFAWPDPARPCLALNGDALSDFDVRELTAVHRASKAAATLWVVRVEDTSAFGVLETDRGGRVVRFVEKPRPGQTSSHWVNAGMYALEPEVLRFIPDGRPVSVEREVFPELARAGLRMQSCAARRSVYWNDIGTPQAYLRANLDVLARRLWKGRGPAVELWGRPDSRGNLVAASAVVAPSARLADSVVGEGCRIGEGAVVQGCVLLPGVRIGSEARLEGGVLGGGVVVGDRCQVRPGAVLGHGTRLAADTRA